MEKFEKLSHNYHQILLLNKSSVYRRCSKKWKNKQIRDLNILSFALQRGWSVEAKVSCILHHQGVQLMLAYSWARPAILVADKGSWGKFLFLLFLHFHLFSFLSCPSLSSPLPASVVQLDALSDWRPGGCGFNPSQGRQHSFMEIDHEIFSTVFSLSSADSRRAVVSFWRKNVHNTG